MLESSHRVRRSQRALPRQASPSPQSQPAPRQRQGGQHKPAPSSRSGLQQLLSSLLSSGAGSSRRNGSRRQQLRQRREGGVEPLRRTQPAARTESTRQVMPLEMVRSEPASRPGSRFGALEQPAPRIRRIEKPQRDKARAEGTAKPGQNRGKPSHAVSSKPRRSFSMSAFTQGVRLVILGVGVWAIVGTALSVWNPSTRSGQVSQAAADSVAQAEPQSQSLDTPNQSRPSDLHLGQEMSALGTRVAPLTQAMSDLMPGVFVMDLDSGDYFSLNGEAVFPAASMIKVPILVAFFQDVDAGKIPLNEVLTLQQTDLASGSGEMQYAGVGTQYSALETATNMIINSDNTATNMIIRRLGGIEVLNLRFREWGLQQTVLHNLLPDLEGTNTLSPKELSTLVARVSEGELVSLKSRDRLFSIMEHTVNNSLLPSVLGEGATMAHKTGDIGSLTGDTGLVDMPSGKRYAISVMVKRPHNDARAYELVVQIGGAVYEYLSQSTNSPTMTGSPASYPSAPTPAISPAGGSSSGR